MFLEHSSYVATAKVLDVVCLHHVHHGHDGLDIQCAICRRCLWEWIQGCTNSRVGEASGWEGGRERLREGSRWKVSLEGIQSWICHLGWQLEPWILPVKSFSKRREDISIGGPREALGQACREDRELRELGWDAKRDWRNALLCKPRSRSSGNSSGRTDQDCLQHLGVDSPQKDRISQDGFQKLCINCFSISNPPVGDTTTSVSPEE